MRRLLALLLCVGISIGVLACGGGHATTSRAPRPASQAGPHRPSWRGVPAPPPSAKFSASGPSVVPTQPAGPTGSYKAVFADGFGALGAWTVMATKSGSRGCCNNSNEVGDMVPAKAVQTPGLLELRCAHETSPLGRPYSCSGVESHFRWQPGHGQTMVFEVEAQWPSNVGEGQDPGWWSSDAIWTDEIDFFEAWGWNHAEYFYGMPCWLPKAGAGSDYCHEGYKAKSELNGPEASFHTFTSVVKPNGEIEQYVDKVHRWNLGPISGINTPWMHLILTHAMRVASTSGSSAFSIKRVEVWEDTGHPGVGLENAPANGVVTGSCFAGTTSCGEEPTPTTPTETTPAPPPPEGKPATPANCKGEGVLEGTAPRLKDSCSSVTGATGYTFRRSGPWTCAAQTTARFPVWATGSAPSFSNGLCVERGHPYWLGIAATNAAGESEPAWVKVTAP